MDDQPSVPPARGRSPLHALLPRVPHEPGVYRFLDGEGAVLYVGKAKDLRKRVASYFKRGGGAAAPHGRTAEMVARARDLEWVVTASETEALLLEDNFIKEHRPPFNLRLRDDKSYPWIEITTVDEWPRVRFFRGRHVPGNLYFGPYSSARKVRETLDVLGRIFPYRKCRGKQPGRVSGSPCLQFFIKRSLGACDGRVEHDEYMEVIAQVVDFLRGRLGAVERDIARAMEEAAEAQQFEKAALLRDRLEAVRHVQERQSARVEAVEAFDVIGLHQGEPGSNLQVFRVREGAVVDRQTFFVDNAEGREPGDVLEEFLLEFYWEAATIPPEIVAPLEEPEHVAAALGSRRGAKVVVRAAKRGPKRRLLQLAQRNAELAAEAEAERRQRKRLARGEALVALQDALGLPSPPLRIECYDISNLGERHAVGSMVVFEGGVPKKAHYRKFAVREVAGQDDFAMLAEVVRRRFRRGAAAPAANGEEAAEPAANGEEAPEPAPPEPAPDAATRVGGADASSGSAAAVVPRPGAADESSSGPGAAAISEAAVSDEGAATSVGAPAEERADESFAARPDLVVVDGGKGQLTAVAGALRAVGVEVPLISLAKQREEVFVPGRRDPLPLAADDPASLLLQRVRDEAHRFAVTFHRQRRSADTRRSELFDALPNVGPVRRRKILEHFGSPERFLAASREELEQVPGLPRKVAREIHARLHRTG
ncbi:MAG: excinuclease ABC subunit UvrC [Thermoleophilia bacterium]|nr:excinuclease ABC subunit UvrC [Thermoleophilia bacterium]